MTDHESSGPRIPGLTMGGAIGRGGFSTVYRARQTAFGRPVAVKVLHADQLDYEVTQRFERELLAVGRLSGHSNIVTVYGAGTTESGQPYLLMELLTGGSLAQFVSEHGPLSPQQSVAIGCRLLSAVEAAHEAGILHRDIKPDNILLNDSGEPQLADFGISSIPEGFQTVSGVVVATMAYAAPEVINGERPSIGSDLYSLAATIVTLMTGAPPIPRRTEELTLQHIARILRDPLPDFTDFGASTDLNSVLQQAMAKNPQDRFVSAAHFRTALERVDEADSVMPIPRSDIASTALTLSRQRVHLAPSTTARKATPRQAASVDPDPLRRTTRLRWRRRFVISSAILAVACLILSGGWLTLKTTGSPASAEVAGTAAPPVSQSKVVPAVNAECRGLVCTFRVRHPAKEVRRWKWTFGDGSSRTSTNSVLHTFVRTGDYSASVSSGDDATSVESPVIKVHLTAHNRNVVVRHVPLGQKYLIAQVRQPGACDRGQAVLERRVKGRWQRQEDEPVRPGKNLIRLASFGTFRVRLVKQLIRNGICKPSSSRGVIAAPAPMPAVRSPSPEATAGSAPAARPSAPHKASRPAPRKRNPPKKRTRKPATAKPSSSPIHAPITG